MNDSKRIYNVVGKFDEKAWKFFVRTELGLEDFDVEQEVKNNPGDIREQRYQMVRKWQRKNGRTATIGKLEELAEGNPQRVSAMSSSSHYQSSPMADENTSIGREENSNEEVRNSAMTLVPAAQEEKYLRSGNGEVTKSFGGKFDCTKKGIQVERQNACDKVKEVCVVPAQKKDYDNSLKLNSGIYRIAGLKKGLALIINNAFLDNYRKIRKGSEIDVNNMVKLWQKMGCELYKGKAHCDQTAGQMKELLKEVNTLEGYCFFVIVIMTHGGVENKENYFEGNDGEKVKINEIEKMFYNSNTEAKHIPKLFIFQFCRGDTVDGGVEVDSDSVKSLSSAMEALVGISHSEDELKSDGALARRIPSISNILVAYATMDGFAALRHTIDGSWFINAITNIFMEHAWKEHVADLLVMVHDQMSEKSASLKGAGRNSVCKAMPEHKTCLTKKFYLFPGYPQ